MLGVELEHALRLGHGAGVGLGTARQDLLHLERQRALGGDARRGVGQVRGHRDLLDLVAQRVLHGAEQVLVLLGGLLGVLLLILGGKVQIAGRHVLEFQETVLGLRLGAVGHSLGGSLTGGIVLVELGHVLRSVPAHGLEGELVDVGREQQHVVAAVEHALDHGHLGQARAVVAGGVVDGLLALGHGGGVLGERDHLVLAGAPEQQQVGELVGLHAIARVDAELEAAAKVLKERLVGLAVLVAHLFELARHALLHALGNGLELAVLLERLARDVQRDVLRIHHAAHEVVVVGQQVGALVHDQDVGAVQREALLVVLAVQVERRARGDEQQGVVLEGALSVEAHLARRVLKVVERGLVELVVVLVRHVGAALFPNGRHGVDSLELLVVLVLGGVILAGVLGLVLLAALGDHHLDGIAHVVAVALDEVLETPLGQVGVVALAGLAVLAGDVLADGEDDVGAVAGALALLDGVALKAVGLPHVRGILAKGAADHAHLRGDHERGVKAHAELADDVDVVALVLGVLLLELLAAGVGDGAQVLLEVLGRHANAVIGDGERAGVLVERDANRQVALVDLDAGVGQALEVELVHGIGRVGDQLAQEDLLVGVDGVDHQVEQLFALRLELAHARSLPYI